MTAKPLAAAWGTSPRWIQRWCRRGLLRATHTPRGWVIAADARRPYMDCPMMRKRERAA
jgi:hypothetical protein